MTACSVCPHRCAPANAGLGTCRARRERGGTVVSDSYGRVTSFALDPIEKKPISRWRSGATVLSIGGYGCNMRCPFCQNARIAQAASDDVAWRRMTPDEIVKAALDLADSNCIGIAYTYNEPLVAWEFVRDTARLAHEEGLANVLVSNGMFAEDIVCEVLPFIDAANIDLKCFSEAGYRQLGGQLRPVKRTIELMAQSSTCHLEVTTLVVPGLSDDVAQIDSAARWLSSLDPRIPYHLTRFFPMHHMAHERPTPLPVLGRLAEAAGAHLYDVIVGNV